MKHVLHCSEMGPQTLRVGDDAFRRLTSSETLLCHTTRMDPAYRPFFAHVWAFCWPWLWWNLVRLTAWRKRTGRRVFISVDKYGNIYIRYVGDTPEANPLPAWRPSWESPALESDAPQGVNLGLNPATGMARIYPFLFRAIYGPFMGHLRAISAPVRAPP